MAIFYDFLEVVGGAERLTIELANSVQQPIVVAGVNQTIVDKLPEITVQLQSIAPLSAVPIWKSLKAMYAFKHIDPALTCAQVNLFSGNNAPLAVYNSQAQRNYYYCHTPPRFVYDLYDYYQQTLPWYQRIVVALFAKYVKSRYEPALARMDGILCNSKNVQARIKKYLGLDAQVIYPPIDIAKYYHKPSQGYYLSTARLENYKRVELVVKAFLKMPDKKLVVLSGGGLLTQLREITENAANIEVIGWVSDERLLEYIAQCIATIYIPIDEDFGMSPVESMAAGKPVIGVSEGGVQETVVHQQTGYLCPANPTQDDLITAVQTMDDATALAMLSACKHRAERFNANVFYEQMNALLSP